MTVFPRLHEKSWIGDAVPILTTGMSPRSWISIKFPGDADFADPTNQLHNHSPGFSPWSLSASLKCLISHMDTDFYPHFSSLFLLSVILPTLTPAQRTLWSFSKWVQQRKGILFALPVTQILRLRLRGAHRATPYLENIPFLLCLSLSLLRALQPYSFFIAASAFFLTNSFKLKQTGYKTKLHVYMGTHL